MSSIWENITDQLTIRTGKQIRRTDADKAHPIAIMTEGGTDGYVIIDNISPGDHFRVTGWIVTAAYLDSNDDPIAGVWGKHDPGSNMADDFGWSYGYHTGGTYYFYQYKPLEVVVPKYSRVASLMICCGGENISGWSYDDLIIEKRIK